MTEKQAFLVLRNHSIKIIDIVVYKKTFQNILYIDLKI